MTKSSCLVTLASLVSLFSVVACSTAGPSEPAERETLGTTSQAVDKDGNKTPEEIATECRRWCIDNSTLPCVNACTPGPGVSACIGACNDKEEPCVQTCKDLAARGGAFDPGLIPPGELAPIKPTYPKFPRSDAPPGTVK